MAEKIAEKDAAMKAARQRYQLSRGRGQDRRFVQGTVVITSFICFWTLYLHIGTKDTGKRTKGLPAHEI